MITEARLNETIKPASLDWVTALRAPAIRSLVEAGAIQLSLFDQCDLAEVTSPDYPGKRLVVCRNPLLGEERTRKRQALLDQTEKKLLPIQARVRRAKRPLRGKDKIALAVGAVMTAPAAEQLQRAGTERRATLLFERGGAPSNPRAI
jgi:hypothetical protein